MMNFGQALEALKAGKKVKRAIWGGYWFIKKTIPVEIIPGDSMDSVGCMNVLIVAKLKDNAGYAPATPYQADILAEDWEIVKDEVTV